MYIATWRFLTSRLPSLILQQKANGTDLVAASPLPLILLVAMVLLGFSDPLSLPGLVRIRFHGPYTVVMATSGYDIRANVIAI